MIYAVYSNLLNGFTQNLPVLALDSVLIDAAPLWELSAVSYTHLGAWAGAHQRGGGHVRAAVKCEEASEQPQGQQFRQKEVEREFYCCYKK